MTLPGTDPYKRAAPNITNVVAGNTIDSVTYNHKVTCDNICIFSQIIWHHVPSGTESIPDEMYMYFSKTPGNFVLKTNVNVKWASGSPGYWTVYVKNPLLYITQTPPHIILGVAHWMCGIAEADIDVTSFDNTHTWCDGNYLTRTVAFFAESCIDIIKELLEQTAHVYIYVNGQQQLACDHLENEPSDTPDWTIGGDNRILKFNEIRNRKHPGKIDYGWDARRVPVQSPDFGVFASETTGIFVDKELILEHPYEAKYVDGGEVDDGYYIDWGDYIICKIEVGGIGFLMDIAESFKLDEAILGMSIDSSYKDNFVIHKIELNPENMTAIITGVKKKWWNIP